LKVTPCDECGARTVCRFTHRLGKVVSVLSHFEWFFEGKEAHLSFNCTYFTPKKEELEG